MKITIELNKIQALLDQQKALCRDKVQETLINKTDLLKHEVRDSVLETEYPKDFQILLKYLTDSETA